MRLCLVLLGLVFSIRSSLARAEDDALVHFERKVRPLLVEHCEKCHGESKQEGGLRLDSREGWRRGGDRGAAVVPEDADASLVIQAVRYQDEDLRMPPRGKLEDAEIAVLVEWVRRGAVDPRESSVRGDRVGAMTLEEARQWWSFRPVVRPAVSPTPGEHPIDALLRQTDPTARLAPEADRRTLIRRATYDLTGLPPTAEEVEAFVRDDAPDAFARLVDRLLESPHYGEQWGRHWLDLVRYADTAGENSDHPLPHAWRYRNWVLRAFQADQPYDEFLREQIAGDLIAQSGPVERYADRVVATGYLALARRFGHDIDKDIHLTHEDQIDNLGKTVLGLTLACARCHPHKYDPLGVEDYYALYGILDSTQLSFPGCEPKQQPSELVPLLPQEEWDRIVRPYEARLAAVDAELRKLDEELAGVVAPLREAIPPATRKVAERVVPDSGAAELLADDGGPLVAPVAKGEMLVLSILPGGNHGADTTLVEWELTEVDEAGEPLANARRWNLTEDVIDDLLQANPHRDRWKNERVWWFLDGRAAATPLDDRVENLDGHAGLQVWRRGELPSLFVNSTDQPIPVWTTLPARTLFVHPAPDGPVAIGWISPLEGRVGIRGKVADAHPGGDGVVWRLEQVALQVGDAARRLGEHAARKADVQRRREELVASAPPREVAYAAREGTPHDARIQLRGDPEKLGDEQPRRWLQVLGGQSLPADSGSGRLELAQWLTAEENPLTARVMANRLWLWHLGRGIVGTPNDFGTRGQPPTHPELLDWLAAEFVDSGWSIKAMHRRIMTSAAYRRASRSPQDGEAEVPYARFQRRRLTAEELRDTLLSVSGELDPSVGGPHPFPPEATWGFTQHNPFAADYQDSRRGVYQLSKRNRREPFVTLFDGADPNASTPERQDTTVPTQALFFMNSPFFHERAAALTQRLAPVADAGERLTLLYRLALQREPTDGERSRATKLLDAYRAAVAGESGAEPESQAWQALVRVVLSSNEFLYID